MEGDCFPCHGEKKLSEGLAGISQMLLPYDHSFAGQNIFSDKADFESSSPSSVSVIAPSSAHGVGPGGEQEWDAEGEG